MIFFFISLYIFLNDTIHKSFELNIKYTLHKETYIVN